MLEELGRGECDENRQLDHTRLERTPMLRREPDGRTLLKGRRWPYLRRRLERISIVGAGEGDSHEKAFTDRGGPAGLGFDGGARGDRGQEQHDGRSRAAVRAEHGRERQPEGAERRRREPQSANPTPSARRTGGARHRRPAGATATTEAAPTSPVPANVDVDVNPTQPVPPSVPPDAPGRPAAGAGHRREHGGHQRRASTEPVIPVGPLPAPRAATIPPLPKQAYRSSTPGSGALGAGILVGGGFEDFTNNTLQQHDRRRRDVERARARRDAPVRRASRRPTWAPPAASTRWACSRTPC